MQCVLQAWNLMNVWIFNTVLVMANGWHRLDAMEVCKGLVYLCGKSSRATNFNLNTVHGYEDY
jgi:hypothetical protein